ncbi:MAG: hypothetical protein LBK73_04020 [Treponema sp.]|jgi:hypothetical protein|nr:hypothetical protein [Treponema sp.]
MAKQKATANQYDGSRPLVDKCETRHFQYLGFLRETGADAIAAFGNRDIKQIKQAIVLKSY